MVHSCGNLFGRRTGSGLLAALEGLHDEHGATAIRAWFPQCKRLDLLSAWLSRIRHWLRSCAKHETDPGDVGFPVGIHAEHEREFNYRRDDAPVSIFRVAITATGMVPKAELQTHKVTPNTPEAKVKRDVWFDGKAYSSGVFERDDLTAGAKFDGPAIVEQFDSTIVIPPNSTAEVDTHMNILIKAQE